MKIRLNVRPTSAARKNGSEQPARTPKDDKKGGAQDHHSNWSVTPAQVNEPRKRLKGDSQAQDAGRSFVDVQQTLLAGFRVCRRRVPPAFTSRELEGEPLLVAPSLVRGLQPNGRRDNVDGPVANDQPLVLRFQEHDETATFGPHAAVGLSAGAPQWRNTSSRPRNIGAFGWQPQVERSSVGPWDRFSAASRSAPLLKSPVRMTAISTELRKAARNAAARLTSISMKVWLRELSLPTFGRQILKSPTRKPTPSGYAGHRAAEA